ncbi:hypothetical protein BD289DRAFT_487401 [Coniella lustricola]|uniref:Protein kinase domain-containing protein n=1 Tax=Coniella lustricola TaxID=2025994 RepID=A0A2T2ZS08_9PEZI|nr:hypothetical protein BD289DRAFT_487401 [Coniella lustricola]
MHGTMQQLRGTNERKTKLARSYQELLDEFGNKELKTVGNYHLGRLIGKGSFGKVYLATHKLTNGSKVVLKSAKKDDSNLAREIHHHRQFVHPHIARLYEVVVTETLVWMVMEYCSGEELYDYLLRHGKLPVEKVQKTFTQLVGAVAYVHQQHCVHRDLKLENILLDKHENVKLLDFGFAREYEGKSNYLQTFCGTICYSAPEMLKGEKYAGEKVDVWSLGIILYALLCGELPFDDDDDDVTRRKILADEPSYPDHLPADALSLLKQLLSKRPFPRPSLADILNHPFLAEHAPEQVGVLAKQRIEPFSTPLEIDTLHRLKAAGVNTDDVVESVLAQKCDTLAGWWTLLLEKEERKQARRERKRKEKEGERRSSRRWSQTSSRLERLAPVGEEGAVPRLGDPTMPPRPRGRSERRSGYYPEFQITDLPGLPEAVRSNITLSPDQELPPPPIDKDSIRSVSSSRRRPVPPPKEGVPGVLRSARSRGSTLHLVTTSRDALESRGTEGGGGGGGGGGGHKLRKKPSQGFISHWKNLTHWLFDSTRRHKDPNKVLSHSTPNLRDKARGAKDGGKLSKENSPRPHTGKTTTSSSQTPPVTAVSTMPTNLVVNGMPSKPLRTQTSSSLESPTAAAFSTPGRSSHSHRRAPTHGSSSYSKRHSLSPSPITPRSTTVRRSSAGLRGRKSTSSSVSSIRSMHHSTNHHHSHSKASSTSSTNSVSTNMSKTPMPAGRSPHHSVKVLPATPTSVTSFPSNIRLVRGAPLSSSAAAGLYGHHNNRSSDSTSLGTGSILRARSTSSSGTGRSTATGGVGLRLAASPMAMMAAPAPPRSPNPFASPFGGGAAGERAGPFFAKRKRNIFKGPGGLLASGGGGGGGGGSGFGGRGTPTGSHSRSVSGDRLGGGGGGSGRPSGEIGAVQEEEEEDGDEDLDGDRLLLLAGDESDRDTVKFTGVEEEDEDDEEDIEEVDNFTPVVQGPGERIEEVIIEPPPEPVSVSSGGGGSGVKSGSEVNGKAPQGQAQAQAQAQGKDQKASLGGVVEEEEEGGDAEEEEEEEDERRKLTG